MFALLPIETMKPGQVVARGVCRWLIDEDLAPITEFSPASGLRTDVAAVARSGEIWVIECKSCAADFQSDHKWRGYLEWCDRFFFAVPGDFPIDLLPPEEGLILADGFGAELVREADARALVPARRKALTQRIARTAMLRLRGALDPGLQIISGGRED